MEIIKNPKMPRLYRDVVLTEKIDGTHGALFIDTAAHTFQAASRNRFVIPGDDNFGFAAWAYSHEEELIETLGDGIHRGEWWGAGIQRRYDMDRKRFSLFATHRFDWLDVSHIDGLGLVPILYQGPYTDDLMAFELALLEQEGSKAAPGFGAPEGIVMYHTAARLMFKYTLGGDGHKGAQ